MASGRSENLLVVTITCLLAVGGVVLLRVGLGLGYQHWASAYLAMGLTASIRRTSAGTDSTVGSALRGFGCLLLGLYASELLGYPAAWRVPPELIPGEVAAALAGIR